MDELDAVMHEFVEPEAEDRVGMTAADFHDPHRLCGRGADLVGGPRDRGDQRTGGGGVAELSGIFHRASPFAERAA